MFFASLYTERIYAIEYNDAACLLQGSSGPASGGGSPGPQQTVGAALRRATAAPRPRRPQRRPPARDAAGASGCRVTHNPSPSPPLVAINYRSNHMTGRRGRRLEAGPK